MDIRAQINIIKNHSKVNRVREAIATAIQGLNRMYISEVTDYVDVIKSGIYGPDIREAILRSFIDILNYRKIDNGKLRSALYDVATKEYGRDLRQPIIDILEAIAPFVGDGEILLGHGWAYDMTNCSFDPSTGVITELDPGQGVAGSDMIINALNADREITVRAESTIGQDLQWCMLLYDSNGDYLYDETIDGEYNHWRDIDSRITWNPSEDVGKFRVFIKDFSGGVDLTTIVSGLDEEDQNAIIQSFIV